MRGLKIGAGVGEGFAEPSLDLVARHGVTHAAGNGEPEADAIGAGDFVILLVAKDVDDERARCSAATLSVHRIEVARAGKASAATH